MRKYIYPIVGISAVIIAYALLVPSLYAQVPPVTVDIQQSNITKELFITGNAIKSIKPDKVNIILTLEIERDNAVDATNTNAKIMNEVINRLKSLGIDEEDISTNYYSIYPIYVPKRSDKVCIEVYPAPPECYEQVIKGYKVINSINVVADANANVGLIIDNAVDAGINRVDSIYFSVSQELKDKITNELLEEAVNDAKTKAEIALRPLNMSIVGVKNISVGYTPIPIYAERDSYKEPVSTSTPIFPSQQQISISVNVTFLIG